MNDKDMAKGKATPRPVPKPAAKNDFVKSVRNFLDAMEHPEFKHDEDKYEDYPVEIVYEGKPVTAFIQDAAISKSPKKQVAQIVLLVKGTRDGEDGIVTMTKTCEVPPTCRVDWDTIHCATSFR